MPLERLASPLHKDCSHVDFPGQEVWKIWYNRKNKKYHKPKCINFSVLNILFKMAYVFIGWTFATNQLPINKESRC